MQLVSVWKVPSEGLSFLATEAIEALCIHTLIYIRTYRGSSAVAGNQLKVDSPIIWRHGEFWAIFCQKI